MKLEILHESRHRFSDIDLSDIVARIESGENMASIARDYGMNYMTFRGRVKRSMSHVQDEPLINLNDVSYRMHDGESMASIARDYGVSLKVLGSKVKEAIKLGQIDPAVNRNKWNTAY